MFGETEMRCAADAVAVAQSDGRGGGRVSVALLLPLSRVEPFLGLPEILLLPLLLKAMLLALLWRWWWKRDPTPEPPEPLVVELAFEFEDADVEPRLREKDGFLLSDGRRSLVKTLGLCRSPFVLGGMGGTAGTGSGGGGIDGGSR